MSYRGLNPRWVATCTSAVESTPLAIAVDVDALKDVVKHRYKVQRIVVMFGHGLMLGAVASWHGMRRTLTYQTLVGTRNKSCLFIGLYVCNTIFYLYMKYFY